MLLAIVSIFFHVILTSFQVSPRKLHSESLQIQAYDVAHVVCVCEFNDQKPRTSGSI